MNTKPLTAIIADDEPAAIDILQYHIARSDIPVDIVGTAASGQQAHALIIEKKPDVAFLDIQMPAPNGLEVAAMLGEHHPTRVVFVTAYDSHAIDAFKVSAIDYLMKPVEESLLNAALGKARDQSLKEQQAAAIKLLLETMMPAGSPAGTTTAAISQQPKLFYVQEGEHHTGIPVDGISFMQASGDYVTIHHDTGSAFVRESLSSLLARIPSDGFVQTHRATAVNIQHIQRLEKKAGKFSVELTNGRRVSVSRSRRAELENHLNG